MSVSRNWLTVEAEIYGDFAVHFVLYEPKPEQDVFAVTHIASGYMVAFSEDLDHARLFADEMNGHNLSDQVKAVRRQEAGGLLSKAWFTKLLAKYQMSVYVTRGKDVEEKGRFVLQFGR